MSQPNIAFSTLAQQDDLSLSNQLSLNLWYDIDHPSLVAENAPQPPTYVLLFGFQLGMQVANLIQQLQQWSGQVSAVCRFEADSDLPPAFVFVVHGGMPELAQQLKQYSADNGVQCAALVNPPKLSEPGLLVMDMDSTAITIECIDEIARLGGVYEEVAAVTAQAMAGKLEFSASLRQRVAKLTGIPLDLVAELQSQLPLMPGIEQVCEVLKQHNWHLAIASGGFVPFAAQVQRLLDLDRIHANELDDDGQVLVGTVSGKIVDAEEKARFLCAYRDELGLAKAQTLAIGDGANDLPMLHQAGLGVAVHGKAKVVAEAPAAITAGSLAQLLYFLTIPAR
ncbi:phosphoserine phosphatase SerB [Pseudoalteromonas sp. T1lg10]|uniref:phosphoserine phosphatase SerB n=1 Tax=Pseudoalteromonas sp. T1lg10 TaxID=2077093 RepID=UPI0018F8796B|nr:phosphoserine phosphatase SerB [Pseudoalteromonas sp. T1lg10]